MPGGRSTAAWLPVRGDHGGLVIEQAQFARILFHIADHSGLHVQTNDPAPGGHGPYYGRPGVLQEEADDASLEQRLEDLSEKVERLEEEAREEAELRCCGESRPIEAEFGEGFALVSEDEEFELRFHILSQSGYHRCP